jgi:hypothetical protein
MRCFILQLAMSMVVLAGADAAMADNCLQFNGTSGRVSVSGSQGMNLAGPFTLESWVCLSSLTGAREIAFKWSWPDAGYPQERSFILGVTDNHAKIAISTTGRSGDVYSLIGGSALTTNTWTHVAGVYDGSELKLFINGQQDGSLATPGPAFSGDTPVYVGGAYYSTDYAPFAGKMDELRISDEARYSANFVPSTNEFVSDAHTLLLMHCNEGQGLWTDNVGINGDDGQLNGGVTWATDSPVQAPEPSSLVLFGIAAASLLAYAWRRR